MHLHRRGHGYIAAGRLMGLFSGYAVTATNLDNAVRLMYLLRAYVPARCRRLSTS